MADMQLCNSSNIITLAESPDWGLILEVAGLAFCHVAGADSGNEEARLGQLWVQACLAQEGCL